MSKAISQFIIVIIFFLVLSGTLSGCTSTQFTDIFQGYGAQMSQVKMVQRQGNFIQAERLLRLREPSNNTYVLNLLEKGRLQFLAANWQSSQASFAQAYQQVEIEQKKAKIQLSKGIEKLSAVVSNDNAISYQLPYYEQSMLHTYQALNYLYQDKLEAALVEIRRANLVQEQALKAFEHQLSHASSTLLNKGLSQNSVEQHYPSMAALTGDIKNGFQNAYTFYLSAVLYEASNEPNHAYIDYKRALEIYPNNRYLQQDVLRLASQLGMSDDLDAFEQQFGKYSAPSALNQGQVVVMVEQDIVSSKQHIGVNLPIHRANGKMKFFSFALPVYQGTLMQREPINIEVNGVHYQSDEIVRIGSLASKDLQEQLPDLITRQVVRVVAKEQMRHALTKEAGQVGSIVASIYNIASEKADTRSWSTLPDEVDIMRMNLPSGKQTLNVSINGKLQTVEIDVNVNRITLINFTAIGDYSAYQAINL